MNLAAYLARTGYEGTLEPTLTTLKNLHRAHLFSIPYENFDIHLSQPLTLELPQIFDKLVTQKRGGWCFEMNGLFAWALRELGFQVTLLGAAVNRTQLDGTVRGHLALRVDLGQPYLCDVGFGDGLLEPVPLTVGHDQQGFLDYELTCSGANWYLRNQPYGAASGFCFDLTPYQLEDFTDVCHALQTSPESGFVRVTVCTRFNPDGYAALRGATLRTVTAAGAKEKVLDNAADFETVLSMFGLEHPDLAALWPRIWQSHLAWVAATS